MKRKLTTVLTLSCLILSSTQLLSQDKEKKADGAVKKERRQRRAPNPGPTPSFGQDPSDDATSYLKKKIAAAEKSLKELAKELGEKDPKVARAAKDLQSMKDVLRLLGNDKAEYEKAQSRLGGNPLKGNAGLGGPDIGEMKKEIVAAEKKLEALAKELGARHPRVRRARAELADLKESLNFAGPDGGTGQALEAQKRTTNDFDIEGSFKEYKAELTKQIQVAEGKLKELAKELGEKHPRVVKARQRVAALKDSVSVFSTKVGDLEKTYRGAFKGIDSEDVEGSLKKQLAESKAKIADAEARLEKLVKEYGAKHPLVARAKENLAALKESIAFIGGGGDDFEKAYRASRLGNQDDVSLDGERAAMKRRINQAEKRVAEMAKKLGKDHVDVKRARARLESMTQSFNLLSKDPSAIEAVNKRTVGDDVSLGAADPFGYADEDDGGRLIVQGLEFQAAGLKSRLKRTEDPKKREEILKKLTSVAKEIVEAKEKRRKEQIEELEKKLKALKGEKGVSVESILEGAKGKDAKKEESKEDK